MTSFYLRATDAAWMVSRCGVWTKRPCISLGHFTALFALNRDALLPFFSPVQSLCPRPFVTSTTKQPNRTAYLISDLFRTIRPKKQGGERG